MAAPEMLSSSSSNKSKSLSSLSSKKKTKKHQVSSATASNSNDTQIPHRGKRHATHHVQIPIHRDWINGASADKTIGLVIDIFDGGNCSSGFQQPANGYQYVANTPYQVFGSFSNQQTPSQAQQPYSPMQAFLDTPSRDQPYNIVASFGELAITEEEYSKYEDIELELESDNEGDDGWSMAYYDKRR